jgi:hypothetical protein
MVFVDWVSYYLDYFNNKVFTFFVIYFYLIIILLFNVTIIINIMNLFSEVDWFILVYTDFVVLCKFWTLEKHNNINQYEI